MKQLIVILLLTHLLTLISCQNEKQVRVSEKIKDKNNKDSSIVSENDVHSNLLPQIIQILEKDNYQVDTAKNIEVLYFIRYKGFEEVERIEFTEDQFKSIYAKRKYPIKDIEGNYFPSFHVYEITFKDSIQSKEYENKINEIINNDDPYNEKDYDYILRDNQQLLYVSAGAKIFEEYAFNYKDIFEELMACK